MPTGLPTETPPWQSCGLGLEMPAKGKPAMPKSRPCGLKCLQTVNAPCRKRCSHMCNYSAPLAIAQIVSKGLLRHGQARQTHTRPQTHVAKPWSAQHDHASTCKPQGQGRRHPGPTILLEQMGRRSEPWVQRARLTGPWSPGPLLNSCPMAWLVPSIS